MYIKWTDAEDNIMKEYYPKIGVMVVDILPARTTNAIKNRANYLGLIYKETYNSWTQEEVDILRAYYPIEGKKCSSRIPNHSIRSVQAMAIKLNIKKAKYI